MASLNRVTLIGNLGNDPDMRYLPDGTAVAKISIATTDTWKDKNGDKKEKTEWHHIVIYRKLAEIAGEYLKKGRSVYIEGRLKTDKWTDKQGVERYTTNIIATDLKMLGSKQNDQQSESNSTPAKAGASGGNDGGFDDMDDPDIPF